MLRRFLGLTVLVGLAGGMCLAQPVPIEEMVRRIRGPQADLAVYRRNGQIQVLVEFGIASWYHTPLKPEAGVDASLGVRDVIYHAAHKTLPFGTLVKVINPGNGRVIVCRITDRGPFIPGRVIDLDAPGAKAIGISGIGKVVLKIFADRALVEERARARAAKARRTPRR
jgi:rare lipoprotein A